MIWDVYRERERERANKREGEGPSLKATVNHSIFLSFLFSSGVWSVGVVRFVGNIRLRAARWDEERELSGKGVVAPRTYVVGLCVCRL